MNKILVVSDNHGDQQILRDIHAEFVGQVDYFFHCGDSELSKESDLVDQFLVVKGNMDFEDFPIERLVPLDDVTIYQTHGHLKNVNSSFLNLVLTAEAKGAGLVLFGHTHQLMCTASSGVLLVNPGSISQPRGEFQSIGGTFCTIEITPKEFVVDYYNREMHLVPDLHFQFDRRDL
ncbi:metallophosphoesterase [Lentilactobacillus sp. SPB1-3]|uniref:Metallophosphoesterase n=1 Tax=Lentilactobacillus terminaliae TaxID=3003483 RepID=A0ACD5DCJ5_9LACO|nr:metallophosphoesterase [Lentilactobacillus sp. SPB1-3]MCZ0977354.1 metallophosphoesterase [Lentilactobacillus sp. SPB1-3]